MMNDDSLKTGRSKTKYATTIAVALLLMLVVSLQRGPAVAASPGTGVVVPLYTYPTDGTWSTTIQVHNAYPNVPMIVIADPTSSGAGTSIDQNYVTGIKNMQAAGITVIGYVDTIYAGRSLSSVENDATNWWNWYHPNGIFFDEFANFAGSESYYSTLNSFVKSLGMTYTMGNPGTTVPSSYYGILNSLMIYESAGYPSLTTLSSATSGSSKSGFGYIAYGVSLNTSFETSSTQYAGWVYITDAGGSNPYNTLPTYFSNEVAALATSSTTSTTSASVIVTTASSTTTTSGATALLSIGTVNTSNQPMSGFYIPSVVDNTLGRTIASGLFTPQTVNGLVGHSYSVTVDDYGGNYVVGASFGAFSITTANGGGGTATFTLQGNTNVAFTLSTSSTSSTTTSSTTPTTKTATTSTSTATLTTTTAGGTKAALSISTADTNNKPLNGFYVESVVDKTTGKTVATGLYSPQTLTAIVGHTYSVTIDDYGSFHVLSASVGTFARNSAGQSGTTTFTLQGNTNLSFTLG